MGTPRPPPRSPVRAAGAPIGVRSWPRRSRGGRFRDNDADAVRFDAIRSGARDRPPADPPGPPPTYMGVAGRGGGTSPSVGISTGGVSGRLSGQDVSRPPVPIDKVVEAFQTNEIRADALYVGKEVEVTGRIARVIVSRHGSGGGDGRKQEYVVELQVRPLDVSRVTVQCTFAGAAREQLAGLKAGQALAHLTFDFGPRRQGRDRVDDDHVDGI